MGEIITQEVPYTGKGALLHKKVLYTGMGKKTVEKILWENPSPTSNFAAQAITLSDNLSNYDYIKVIACYATTATTNIVKTFMAVSDFKQCIYNIARTPMLGIAFTDGSSTPIGNIVRDVAYANSETSIRIYECRAGANTYNNLLIPLQIIGIKEAYGDDGIIYGEEIPSNSIGKNGNYYYKRVKQYIKDETGFSVSSYSGSSYQTMGGYKFTPNENIMVYGARIYTTGNLTSDTELRLSDENGIITNATNFVTKSYDWTEVLFDDSVNLEAGQSYYIECLVPGTYLVYFDTNSINVSNKITLQYGVYSSNRNVDNSNVYSCDILIGHKSNDYVITKQYIKKNNVWEELTIV